MKLKLMCSKCGTIFKSNLYKERIQDLILSGSFTVTCSNCAKDLPGYEEGTYLTSFYKEVLS
jgi:hypothetical protein